jgi:hypothetical protein
MPEFVRPSAYLARLELVQRLVKSAQYRTDPKLAVRELCEALLEMSGALIDHDKASNPAGATENKPAT